MFFLAHSKSSDQKHLITGTCFIGRDSNSPHENFLKFPIKSISKSHCKLTLSGTSIFATDDGSTHGTFVNDQKLRNDDEKGLEIKDGDVLKLGVEEFSFRKIKISICFSGLAVRLKSDLSNICKELGIEVVEEMSQDVHYLVTNGISITQKVVLALCYAIPLVSSDLLLDLHKKKILGPAEDYAPDLQALPKKYSRVSFAPNLSRKSLFDGVLFFTVKTTTSSANLQIEAVVTAAGGKYAVFGGVSAEEFKDFLMEWKEYRIVMVKSTAKVVGKLEGVMQEVGLLMSPPPDIYGSVLYNNLEHIHVLPKHAISNLETFKGDVVVESDDDEIFPPTPKNLKEPAGNKSIFSFAKPKLSSREVPITIPQTQELSQIPLTPANTKISIQSLFGASSAYTQPREEVEQALPVALETPQPHTFQTQTQAASNIFSQFMDDIDDILGGSEAGVALEDESISVESSQQNIATPAPTKLPIAEPQVSRQSVNKRKASNSPEPVAKKRGPRIELSVEDVVAEVPNAPESGKPIALEEFKIGTEIEIGKAEHVPEIQKSDDSKTIQIIVEITPLCQPSNPPMENYKVFKSKAKTLQKVLAVVPACDIDRGGLGRHKRDQFLDSDE